MLTANHGQFVSTGNGLESAPHSNPPPPGFHMFTRYLIEIRKRFHPFHAAKRIPIFSQYILPRLDIPLSVRLHDVDWRVRVRLMRHLSYIVNSRIVEPGESALFLAIIRCCDCRVFWDVGANFGYYSWLFLSADACNSAVLFEPDPANLRLIDDTIRRNRLDHTDVVAAAVSDTEGEAPFVRDHVSGATGALAGRGRTFVDLHYGLAQKTMTVPTVTLDGQGEARPLPDLVKIDVEGVEDAVVRGGRRLIERRQPIVLFESFDGERSEAATTLTRCGYRILNADSPDGNADASANYLAWPRRLQPRWNEVLDAWRAIHAEWSGRDHSATA